MISYRSKHILLCLSLGLTISSTATNKASKRPYSETIEAETGYIGYPCMHPGCEKAYSTKAVLKRHEAIHSEKPVHVCRVCNKIFLNSTHLDVHMYTHTGERPFKCRFPKCGMAFTQPSNLRRHRSTHINEKTYECDFPDCSRAFKRFDNLSRHRRTHEDAKNSAITVPAGSPTSASAPIPHLPAAGCDLPVSTYLPQNPDEMDKLDGFLEKFPWKSEG